MGRSRAVAVAGLALALVVVGAAPAFAHANLVGAAPAPGAALPQAPGAVVLHFSEAVDHVRSTLTVTGPDGHDAAAGPTRSLPGDGRALRRPLGLEPPGRYDVVWTAVSVDDGHAETGRYSFGIGVPAPAARHVRGGAVSSEGLLGLLGELTLVAGLTVWAGTLLIGRPALRAGVDTARLRALRTGAATVALAGVVVRAGTAAARAPTLGRVMPTILAGRSGAVGTLIVAAAVVAGLLAPDRLPIVLPASAVALTAHAAAGHAAAAPVPAVAVGVLAVHMAAAGVWLSAIAVALLAPRLRRAVAVLSPYAVASAVGVGATGAAGAALQRVGAGQLLTAGYGRMLLAKALIFVVVAGLGGWQAWRRHRRSGARALRTPVRLEAAAACMAVVVATVLSASPPPTRFPPALHGGSADPVFGALDANQALTVADATGPYVVGLTLSPARAGPLDARVEILSTGASDVFSDVFIHAASADGPVTTMSLRPVSAGVFAGGGRIEHNGDWSFGVSFVARGEPNQVTMSLSLPAPDGSGVLAEAFAAEERLTSVRLHETLRSMVGSAPLTADYQFRAPDSFTFTVNGTSQIDIGARAYRKVRPEGPWTSQDAGAAFSWPSPYFRQAWAKAAGARVVGAAAVDGVPSHVVAFVRSDLPAWFELWVGDSDGLVRREEMRAEGHLMRHDYAGFNAPTTIVPPP